MLCLATGAPEMNERAPGNGGGGGALVEPSPSTPSSAPCVLAAALAAFPRGPSVSQRQGGHCLLFPVLGWRRGLLPTTGWEEP